jgi:hypothetical protein
LYAGLAVAAYVFMLLSASRSPFAGVYLVVLGAPLSLSGSLVAVLRQWVDERVGAALAFSAVTGGVAVNAGILYFLAAALGGAGRKASRGALLLAAGAAAAFTAAYLVRL